jgi:trimeric autotransporter adhesin
MKKIILFSILLIATSYSMGQTIGVSQISITPQTLFHVHNTSAGQLFQLSNASTSGGNSPTANSGFNIGIDASMKLTFNQYENATMSFLTNHVERITILGNGLVGVWNTNPSQAKLNIASANSSQDGVYSEHSSAATGAAYSAIQGVYSGSGYTAAQGNIAYHASTNKTYSLYGTGGDFGAFIQNKTVIGNVHPDLTKNIFDLEVQNTTSGAGSPAAIAIRQTTSLTTNGDVLSILNFCDNSQANPQAQIKVIRDAAAGGLGSSDLPTAMTFFTMADATNTLSERMRISNAGNVGIGTNNPSNCALLDISSSTLGLLIPHLALTAVGTYAPATGTAVDGLLVYSTSAPTGGAGKGYYYWSTTAAQWISLIDNLAPGKPWLIDGNAGTTAGTNFLGTTDDVDLVFKRNNVQAGLLNSANSLTSFGVNAGLGNVGSFNTSIGTDAFRSNISGSSNTAVGKNSQYYFGAGAGNTAIGMYSLEGGSTPASNTGSYNTAIGYAAGSGYNGTPDYLQITTGSYNTFLGYNSALSASTYSNSTAIGANSEAGTSNVIVLGSINGVNTATASTNVGIGIIAPTSLLHIVDGGSGFTTGDLVTITGNSLTTGKGLYISSSSLTSGNLLDVRVTNSSSTGAAIYASSTGTSSNALQAVGGGAVNYSAIFAQTDAVANGTDYGVTTSNHAIYGKITGSKNYSYGVYGEAASAATNSGGVLGFNNSTNYGALGFYDGSFRYGVLGYSSYFGVFGHGYSSSGSTYGVYGLCDATGTTNYGVYGYAFGATTNYAGYFKGNTAISDGHIRSIQTTAPTYTAGAGAGTTPTISLSKATDVAGIINVTTGTAPSAWNAIVTINFNKTYSSAPIVVFSPFNSLAAGVSTKILIFNITTSGFDLYTSAALAASSLYIWSYMVIETQ